MKTESSPAPWNRRRIRLAEHGMGRIQMKDDESHLWWVRPDRLSDPALVERYTRILTEDERDRVNHYIFDRDRHTALATRAAIRCLLSRYTNVEPSEWRFRRNRYGRPEVASPVDAVGLQFNVAHTKGLVAVLISKNRRVGVDAECLPYEGPCLRLAERYFSRTEAETLRDSPESERPLRFIEYWVLKESFIKAQGMGMTIPLDSFSFCIGETRESEIRIQFSESFEFSQRRWRFTLNSIGKEHVVATAVERFHEESLQLYSCEWIPEDRPEHYPFNGHGLAGPQTAPDA